MGSINSGHEGPKQTAMSDSMKVFLLVSGICASFLVLISGLAGYAISEALND